MMPGKALRKGWRWFAGALASLCLAAMPSAGALADTSGAAVPGSLPASAYDYEISGWQVPPFAHIVIVMMENKPYSAIMGNSSAPFINSLAARYAYSDSYAGVAHPSLPNYLALAGGDTFGIRSDCTGCFVQASNLVDTLTAAGKSWKAYMEDMPGPCFVGGTATYGQKHNPFIYFNDIRNDPARCGSIVPLSQLGPDLAAGTLPDFVWITPNICHDMHDCSVGTGDRWLQSTLTPLLDSPAFSQQSSVLAIVWDENDGSRGNRVPLILAGSQVAAGYVSHVPATHYSLLKTVEAAWNLESLGRQDDLAQPLTDFFLPF